MTEKKKPKSFNYRAYYKQYYGIEFGSNYVVHHIDFNRENNDIRNLLLLPKELHAKYHLVINALSFGDDKPKADGFLDFRLSNANITDFNAAMVGVLPETIAECCKWTTYKRYNYKCFMPYDFGGKNNGGI